MASNPFPALLEYRVRKDDSIYLTSGEPHGKTGHSAFDIHCGAPYADFIVKAVNAHDDLVAVLKDLAQCDATLSNVANADVLAARVRHAARTALTKAGAA